jgi:hypothetical protein
VRLRPVLAVAFAAIVFTATVRASADPAADLEKAHNAYVAHQYDEAESALRALLDPTTGTLKDPDNIADARMYLGATLVAEKKNDEAARVFADLLTDRPEYQPDALRVSLDAMNAFTDARARNRDRLATIMAEKVRKAQEEKAKAEAERQKEALRVAMLEKLASTEVITHDNSRLIALVPFGAGQFQNGQTGLAWTLLVSEGLLVIGSGVGAAMTGYNLGQVNNARQQFGQGQVANGYNSRAQQWAYVGDSMAGAFFLVALVGVLHAELTFVPDETTTRPRALPVSLTPVLGPTGAGIVGSF